MPRLDTYAAPRGALGIIIACGALIACGDVPTTATDDGTVATPDATTPDVPEVGPPDVELPTTELHLSGVAPERGLTSGLEEVQLTGGGLSDVVAVLFGDTPALDPFAVSDELLVALSPPHPHGLVDVTVVTADGRRWTLPLAFNFADPVQLTAVTPEEGHWLGGERLTLHGAGFTEDAVVVVGTRPALAVALIDDNTLSAVTPEGTPGKVDVYVSTGEGVGHLAEGYEYTGVPLPDDDADITGISPARGPVAGGTDVTIEGFGFEPGAAVRIGALSATDVVVESDTRIRATTPTGSPGPATVRIIQSGRSAELVAGFRYDAEPAVWVVDPPQGAVAGNTRVTIRGHGFPVDAAVDVRFAGAFATDVQVIDEMTIVCRTPPGPVGLAAVEVSGGGISAVHPQGFSYFDPAATPGTWGPSIDGNLNITVQDARSGARLAGATVVLGPSANTRLRGVTDALGQITFSDDALAGRQTVTASVTGYQVFQLAGFDAENVTLPLERIPTCEDIADMPCDQIVDPPPVAYLVARIVGSEKGPTIPFGECRDWPDAVGGMCEPCAVDSDCKGIASSGDFGEIGEGDAVDAPALCRELGSEGAFCTFGCQTDNDCAGGFVCLDPSGQELEKRCVPPPGEPATYCDQTEPDLASRDTIPYPGVRVPSSKVVQTAIHLGDFAAFCWSGVTVRGQFRPQFLGVTRNLGAYENGEVVETEIALDIPLSQRVVIEVERPANGPFGEELTVVMTALDLNGDGILAFPTKRGFLSERFVLNVPEALTGELYDATWTMFTEVDVTPLNGGSALYERGLDRLDSDIDYVERDGAWAPFESPALTTRALTTWQDGPGSETVVAVGEDGSILKRYGNTWAYMNGATDRELMAIAAAPATNGLTDNAIAVGQGGVAIHWDGLIWRQEETGTPATLEGVAFGSEEVAFAIAGPHLLRWDGQSWSFLYQASTNLHGVVAPSADEVYAVGDGGTIVHGWGGDLQETAIGAAGALNAVTIASDGTLVAAGDGGLVVTGDAAGGIGQAWQVEETKTNHDLQAAWARGEEVFAVGSRATILYRKAGGGWSDQTLGTTRATLRAVAGTRSEVYAMGSHELVIGPLLGIPEDLVPSPGGFLNDSVSWTARSGLDPHFSLIEFESEVGPCSACGFLFMLPYSEWRSVLHGDLFEARFPDFAGLGNTVSLGRGVKGMTLYRVRADERFDFDHTATSGFFGGTWRAWSWRTEAFLH